MNSEMKKHELNDSELENVTGGYNEEEILRKINSEWAMVPETIRSSVIDKYHTAGKKAAYRLCRKLAEENNLDWMLPMADLFL